MIYPITMYACKCDGCGEKWVNADSVCAYADREKVKYSVHCTEWHFEDDGRAYCPKCYRMEDDDTISTISGDVSYPKDEFIEWINREIVSSKSMKINSPIGSCSRQIDEQRIFALERCKEEYLSFKNKA